MTKPQEEMNISELIWAIEGNAKSARRSFKKGNNGDKELGIAIAGLARLRKRLGI